MKNHCAMAMFLLYASTIAIAEQAFAQDAEVEEGVIEEIVVHGIRESLNAAAAAKRADSRIIDTVVAEDIGKLPDNNVAEALQRITGVSINRDFGVGSEVSIRGLPQNRVEVNGRTTLGDGRNGVNFQDFPADFLAAVEVVKSPTPKMIEGALGGTINLKMLRPLDLNEQVISVSARAEYADLAESWGPILNGTFGNNWELGDGSTFGVIANISFQDRELRRDEARLGFDVEPLDLDGDGNLDPGNVIIPKDFTSFPSRETRERIAGNLSLQWAPASGNGMVYLEATATDRSGTDETFSPNLIQVSPLDTDEERAAGFRIDDTGQVLATTDSDVTFINRTESGFRNTEFLSGALGGEWTSGRLDFSAEVSYGESDTFEPYSDLRFYGVDPVAEAANPSELNPLLSSVFYDSDNNGTPTVRVLDPSLWLDPTMFVFRRLEAREDFITNDETAARFDVTFNEPIEALGLISSIDFGVRYADRGFERSRDRVFVTNIENGLEDADGNPIVIYMSEFPQGTIREYDIDLFPGSGRTFDLGHFLAFDAALLQDTDRVLGIVGDLVQGTNREINGDRSDFEFEFGQFAAVGEETLAAYFQVNFDTEIFGLPTRGIIGARYVETDLTTGAFERDTEGQFVPVSDGNKYDNWLPSVNLTTNLQDDLLLRFAAAKVMRRPEFGQLSPALNVNSDNTRADRGNPQLDPFQATQYDLSLEKYWGNGNLISAAVFYKEVSSFFDETEICLDAPTFVAISNPNVRNEICFLDGRGDEPTLDTPLELLGIPTQIQTNGDSGTVRGFELGYQHAFDFLPGIWSGLGTSANYTYADSEDPNGVPLEDISKNTFNFQGYYEKDRLGLRLAYTYRSRFLDNVFENRVREVGDLLLGPGSDDPTLGNSYREPIEQLDFSASYDVSDSVRLQFDIVNLTEEEVLDTATSGSLWQVLRSDRRFSFGVSARF